MTLKTKEPPLLRGWFFSIIENMFFDLNGQDKETKTIILDNVQYFFAEIENMDEIKNMIIKIDDNLDMKSQWLPIVRKILEPYNDVNDLSIENQEQLIKFISFINARTE